MYKKSQNEGQVRHACSRSEGGTYLGIMEPEGMVEIETPAGDFAEERLAREIKKNALEST